MTIRTILYVGRGTSKCCLGLGPDLDVHFLPLGMRLQTGCRDGRVHFY